MGKVTETAQGMVILNITDTEKDLLANKFELYSKPNGEQIFDASNISSDEDPDIDNSFFEMTKILGKQTALDVEGYYCILV